MTRVVGVRFREAGKMYYFDPGNFSVRMSDNVIVETARGIEYGEVITEIQEIDDKELVSPLKPVLRIADESDAYVYEQNKGKAEEALRIATQKVNEHGLAMKLIDSEYTFDCNKVIIYFSAENRIDFRELVKDIASVLRTRIELRQIGVRDQAKLVGGIGPCGRVTCCKQFLGDFEPVSIKMAKDQSLSLNPTKISGLCGRLMCCLKYEQCVYEDKLKRMPRMGAKVLTEDGEGPVVGKETLSETVQVRIRNEEGVDEIRTYAVADIQVGCPKDTGRNAGADKHEKHGKHDASHRDDRPGN